VNVDRDHVGPALEVFLRPRRELVLAFFRPAVEVPDAIELEGHPVLAVVA
jgi:hypothetical protein